MANDSFSEVSSQGWLSRLGQSIMGVLIGIILFIVSFPLLFWNEGRAVRTARSLSEGAAAVVSVGSDKVEPANEGKLVHITGQATADQTLKDPQFDIAARALRLERVVQMYQWREKTEKKTRKKLGGGEETVTTYSYHKEWSPSLIDSSSFREPTGHENPRTMPFQKWSQTAEPIKVGAFVLSSSLVQQITKSELLPVDQAALNRLPTDLKSQLTLDQGAFFSGASPASPAIGNVRIEFHVTQPTTVSLLAQQTKDSFQPFQAKAGDTINRLQIGSASAAEMFAQLESENRILTWILRVVGFVLMAAGVSLVFRPLVVLADVIPIVGSILETGILIFAIAVALPLSLLTIAIGWIAYRPLLGIGLLVAAGGIFVGIWLLVSKRRAA